MNMASCRSGEALYIYLSGEIDEHSVKDIREEADKLIDDNAGLSRAVFNLAGVRFMDSTGIGFLIGRYKRLKKYNMGMFVESPEANTDKILLIYSQLIYDVSDVIGTYVYRRGMIDNDYGYSAAVGFFNSVVGMILLTISNGISRKIGDTSLF